MSTGQQLRNVTESGQKMVYMPTPVFSMLWRSSPKHQELSLVFLLKSSTWDMTMNYLSLNYYSFSFSFNIKGLRLRNTSQKQYFLQSLQLRSYYLSFSLFLWIPSVLLLFQKLLFWTKCYHLVVSLSINLGVEK